MKQVGSLFWLALLDLMSAIYLYSGDRL